MTAAFLPTSTLDAHPDAVMLLRCVRDRVGALTDFECLFVNKVSVRTFGRADLVGRRLFAEMPAIRDAGLWEAFACTVARGEAFRGDVRYRDGSLDQWLRVTAVPTDDGLLTYFSELVPPRPEPSSPLLADGVIGGDSYDSAPVLMGVVEPTEDGDVLHLHDTPATCAFFGVGPGGTRGRRATELGATEEAIERWCAHYREAQTIGAPVKFEHPFETKSGQEWLAVTVAAVGKGPSGRMRFCYVAENVTERRRMEGALRAALDQVKLAVTAAGVGYWAWALDTGQVDLDPRCAELFECESPTHIDEVMSKIVPEDREHVLRGVRDAVDGSVPYRAEFRLRLRDGSTRWLVGLGSVVSDADGRRTRMSGVNLDATERRIAEEALRSREAELRLVTDHAPIALAHCDADGRFVFVNRAYADQFGRVPEDIVGRDIPEIFGQATYARLRPYVEQAMAGRRVEFEVPFVGSRIVHCVYAPEADAGGGRVGFVAAIQDVTARWMAEDGFRRREAWLAAIVDGSPIGIAVFDRDLRFLRVNPALVSLNGIPAVRHIGRTMRDVMPVAIPSLEERFRQVVETAVPVVAADYGGVLGGRMWHAQVSIYPVVVDGAVEGVVGMIQDVTEKKAEERRRDLLARASRVFAGTLEIKATVDAIASTLVPELADVAVVHLRGDDGNLAVTGIAHQDPKKVQLVRDKLDALLPAARSTWPSATAIRTGSPEIVEVVEDEALKRWAAGDEDWLATARELGFTSSLVAPLVVHGQTLGVLGLFSLRPERRFCADEGPFAEEIARRAAVAIENARLFEMAQSERRRADEANRAKDEFLAVVSHELRTPLNAVLGWARMLVSGSLDGEKARRAAETIERNAKAQAQLIEDLLDVSRIITGKLRLEIESVDLGRVIDSAIEVVTPAAEAKGVRIDARINRTVDRVVGDPNRLQQAIWNLLTNAVKFTPRDGSVVVRLERERSSVVLTVEDTGQGIEPSALQFIFDRFRQADMGTRRHHGGLGLGLAIVRHISELHGGGVEAESDGVGRGATFRLRIPITPARRERAVIEARRAPESQPDRGFSGSTSIRGLRVLVVDDHEDARELLKSMLEELGSDVQTAASSRDAYATMRAMPPDVLLSDIGMPEEDGYDLIEKVRSLPPEKGGRIPAVALTAYARSVDRTRALLAGYNAHLTKPVEPGELVAVLANVTGRLPQA